MTTVPRLHLRLRSCLQAILDLEPELKAVRAAEPLLTELTVLKEIYGKIETLSIQEEDVQRIEEATANFFEELKGSFRRNGITRPEQRFLQ
jgi:hypothetical protein